MSHTSTVDVGQRVRISGDVRHVRRCFDFIQYQYSELMDEMSGTDLEVVCHARENCGTNIVGLPSPDGSQDGVWYFPVTVLEAPKAGELPDSSESSQKPPLAHAFRWELRRQSEDAHAFELGDVIVHSKYGYRGCVVGFDDVCMQTEAWIETMGVDGLPKGRDQPFYHVLVDARDRAGDQVTYVAQENMRQPDAAMGAAASEFVLSGEPLRHRLLTSLLKLDSFDAERCAYEPLPELRAIYPRGVEGCWMVDAVIPDGSESAPADEVE